MGLYRQSRLKERLGFSYKKTNKLLTVFCGAKNSEWLKFKVFHFL